MVNAWQIHVAKVRLEHPELKNNQSEIFKLAKETYKKESGDTTSKQPDNIIQEEAEENLIETSEETPDNSQDKTKASSVGLVEEEQEIQIPITYPAPSFQKLPTEKGVVYHKDTQVYSGIPQYTSTKSYFNPPKTQEQKAEAWNEKEFRGTGYKLEKESKLMFWKAIAILMLFILIAGVTVVYYKEMNPNLYFSPQVNNTINVAPTPVNPVINNYVNVTTPIQQLQNYSQINYTIINQIKICNGTTIC